MNTTISHILQEAIAHQQAGRLPQAEALYQQVLRLDPDHPDALHLLGMVAHQAGRSDIAAELISKAIRVKPSEAMYHNNLALALENQGMLDAAIENFRKALSLKPDYARARQNLELALQAQSRFGAMSETAREAAVNHLDMGNKFMESGQLDAALASIDQAIALQPGYVDAHLNRGAVLLALRQPEAALASFDRAIALKPGYAGAYINRGIVLYKLKRPEEALASYDRAIALQPDYADAYNNRGLALKELNRMEAALASFDRAIAIRPDYPEACLNRGEVLLKLMQPDAALASLERAIALKPGYAEAYYSRGLALTELKQTDAALASYDRAIALKPDYAVVCINRGNLLFELDRTDEALASYEQAIAIQPGHAEAHNNLGNVLKDQGRLDEAAGHYHNARAIEPDNAEAYSNLLFTLNYHPDLGAQDIYRAYREYDAARGIPLRSSWRAHNNDRDTSRRLRVGYVSPDFRRHSVRFFLEPLLAGHDKAQVEVFAYAEQLTEDEVSLRYRSYADHWIPTRGMSDGALAERIRSDGIDILVELAGHTAGNRLLTFARKPAPVSVSWLGYGYTTGLSAIDYYLTDETCAPAGSEGLFAERPWRIATPAYVYRPNTGMGEVGSLPALRRGHVTFGTLTRSVRINHRTIRAWSEILEAVPGSRLVIDSGNFKDPEMQERMAARFAEHGIKRSRLEIGCHSPPWDVLRGTDIGLDCFPHNSGATLFETLYMGVPYITLAGRPSVGRLGGSILRGAGHPEWVAASEDEYVAKAVELAGDLTKLSQIRAALRGEMEASPLMDEQGFARRVEAAYRGMWQEWCGTSLP